MQYSRKINLNWFLRVFKLWKLAKYKRDYRLLFRTILTLKWNKTGFQFKNKQIIR